MKAKISPRQKAGSNRGSHIQKQTKPDNKGPKTSTAPFYKASKKPVLLQKPESQVSIMINTLKHKPNNQ